MTIISLFVPSFDAAGIPSSNPSSHRLKTQNAKLGAMKEELKRLLAQPLVARGVSTRYITSGSRPIVDDIVSGDCESSVLLFYWSWSWTGL